MAQWVDSKTVGGVSEVTLLTPIKHGTVPGETRTYEQRLNDALKSTSLRVAQGLPTPIGRIPTIHYARWLILLPQHYLFPDGAALMEQMKERPYRSWLLFMSNFDGDMKTYLRDFSVFLADDVDRVWGNCEGYPDAGCRDFDAYWAYAKKHQLTTQAFYNAYPYLTVPRIHELAAFRRLFDAFVAETRRTDGTSIDGLEQAFDRFLQRALAFPQDFPARGGTYVAERPGSATP